MSRSLLVGLDYFTTHVGMQSKSFSCSFGYLADVLSQRFDDALIPTGGYTARSLNNNAMSTVVCVSGVYWSSSGCIEVAWVTCDLLLAIEMDTSAIQTYA